ncbi:membrane metallo-endopeptidase-like 1 [Musca autumnalis]|uniref:membrane metallo-endopeptidase-like 1 n=1 Tax=Musca autumnalis TaxID=221902 RepID=UPI003CE84091
MLRYVGVISILITGGIWRGINADSKPNLLNEIKMSMDPMVDPCEDFYAYSCNNWAEHHPNGDYGESTGLVDNRMNIQLINHMESSRRPENQDQHMKKLNFFEKAFTYYESCVNETSNNFFQYFDGIKPGNRIEWPILQEAQALRGGDENYIQLQWPMDEFDLFALLGKLQSYGLNNVLIKQEMARTQNGSLQILLEIPQVEEDENEKDELPAYLYFLDALGIPKLKAYDYIKRIKATRKHWHQVYRNFSETESEEDQPKKLSFEKLQHIFPKLAIFLENILPSNHLRSDDFVVIYNVDYFQYLMEKEWPSRVSQNICNYLMVKFLIYLFKDKTHDFTKMECIKDLRNKMDLAVNYIYHQHIIVNETQQYYEDMVFMVHKIYKHYMAILEENHLKLNSQQLELLKTKINSLRLNLGNLPKRIIYPQYPENLKQQEPPLNPQEIENFFANIPNLHPSNYYQNHLDLLKHRFWKSLLYEQNFSHYISTDNALGSSSTPIYYARQNMIILFQGFLQDPIYNLEMDQLSKWSLLGFILAHEFTHAIDTSGMLFGPDGYQLDSDLGIQDHENFTQALECLQQQLPTDSIDERLADLMGARVVYNVYSKEANWQTAAPHSQIPWKKLFFLNISQFFCGRKDVKFRDHDSDAERLHQIVANYPVFAETFKCRTGSKMNPIKKCRVF